MLAFSGKPISSIRVLPIDSPISQTCLDIIRRKPKRKVRVHVMVTGTDRILRTIDFRVVRQDEREAGKE